MKKIILVILLLKFTLLSFSQDITLRDYEIYIGETFNEIKYNPKKNIYHSKNIIYIFVDEIGNLIKTGLPTTSLQDNKYKVIILTTKNKIQNTDFKLEARGDFKPTFNIEDGRQSLNSLSVPNDKIIHIPFSIIGPYTEKFDLKLIKINTGVSPITKEVILDRKVSIAKTYHVTLSTGIFFTTLKNPSNIRTSLNNNGETTLIADDENERGIVSINAVFYPKGRNFLFPPENWKERFGFLVGTRLDKDQFKNFLAGVQLDFARGGSISTGLHYGRRNVVNDLENFDFGEDIFTGDDIDSLIKKEWNLGFFIGINLDIRVFGKIFNLTN